MNNNTQIEKLEDECRDVLNYLFPNNKTEMSYLQNKNAIDALKSIANFQKQQDKAKYNSLSVDELLLEREKLENLIRSKDEMALVNYELKQLGIDELPKSYITDLEAKYQELLDSHNELLKTVRLIEASIAGALDGLELDNTDDEVGKSIVISMFKKQRELINKAKNIKQ